MNSKETYQQILHLEDKMTKIGWFIFDADCTWLESEAEIHTVTEIYNRMIEIAGSKDSVYSQKWLKIKLKERYGDHITFSEG